MTRPHGQRRRVRGGSEMGALRRFLIRLVTSVTRRRDEERLREEVEAHLALQAAEHLRAGLSPVEARRQALLKFGAVESVKEHYRDEQGLPVLDSLGQDMRYTLRQLRRAPSFTLTATLTLALGIGATAAIFSLFNQMLLRALPVSDPDRLVNLSATGPRWGSHVGDLAAADAQGDPFTYPMFRDLERLQTSFTGIAAHKGFGASLSFQHETLSGSGLAISGSYFSVLGVQPTLGRLVGPGDDRAVGESDVVVLSHAYWQRRFGGNPNVLNDTLVVNGRRMTIVGVAPRGFEGTTLGRRPEVYVPITMYGYMNPGWEGFDDRRSYWAMLFARLQPAVTLDQARTAVNAVYRGLIRDVEAPLQEGLSEKTLAQFKAKTLDLEPGHRGQSYLHRGVRTPLTLLLAVTGLVLLIACANVANLLLGRAATRTTEMAVRLSVGARRGRLIVQLLTESCLLAALGGVAGLVVAKVTLSLMASLLPEGLAGSAAETSWGGVLSRVRYTVDADVVLFAAAVTLATSLLFGLFPAIHSTRPNLVSALKGTSGQPSGGRGPARVRTALATTQIALSMTLLVAAGLFLKSLMNVSRVDLGMTIDQLVTFRISPEQNGYTPARAQVLFERLENELASQPGVTSVTASFEAAVGDNQGTGVRVQGFTSGPDIDSMSQYNEIAPGYFTTMGIPLIAGREITRADTLGAPRVALVNEAFAKKFGLGRDAVGKRISWDSDELDAEIVGLVQDAKYDNVKNEVPPLFFYPYRQNEDRGALNFYVRTSLDPERMIGTLPRVVATLDPDLPVENVRTVAQQVQETVFLDRFISVLSTAFAILATLLAAIGLYGVLAYTVAQRTREIGLRMALGAAPGRVRRMVLRQVALMTAVGGVLGLAGAVALGRAAQALLFELEGHDPMVLTAAAVALTLVALGAGSIPAHRAARVDPMRALRYE
ncbi:MAG: FtsX-like permease family protein [Luteitalea sp.]|nr:FtsX-like permease family protein [Luteitalea sp.]